MTRSLRLRTLEAMIRHGRDEVAAFEALELTPEEAERTVLTTCIDLVMSKIAPYRSADPSLSQGRALDAACADELLWMGRDVEAALVKSEGLESLNAEARADVLFSLIGLTPKAWLRCA